MGHRFFGFFLLVGFVVAGPTSAADWPQWRGPDREGRSPETGLAEKWPEDGPPVKWQVDHVGVGYSSMAVVGDRIYTQGDLKGVEHVLCLAADDGSVVWAKQPKPIRAAMEKAVQKILDHADRDGNGVIDRAEAIRRLGRRVFEYEREESGDAKAIAEERARSVVEALDRNGDGELIYAEAAGRIEQRFRKIDRRSEDADVQKLAAERARALFNEADQNDDGEITKKEASGSFIRSEFKRADEKENGERDQVLTRAEVRAYLLRFEPGHDGRVTVKELARDYAKRYPRRDGIVTKEELRRYKGGYRNGRGDGPRGTPTVVDGRVYSEGGRGDVSCLDARTGETIWHVSLTDDLGGRTPGWGYSESPLVTDQWVIVTPGGPQGAVAALDKETGKVVWQAKGTTQKAGYSAPQVATLAGRKQVVQFASKSLFGLDYQTGKLLWEYSGANNGVANICTPVVWKNHVFASSAYGTGGGLVKIRKTSAGLEAKEVYFEDKMANHHGGIVRVGKHIYGFGRGGLICMDYMTGDIAWTARSVRKGSLIYADGMLYCLSERHKVALAEATPAEYRENGRFDIEDRGRPSWAHPVIADGTLYIRNLQWLTAYDIRETTKVGQR